jgi:hypothetical protein
MMSKRFVQAAAGTAAKKWRRNYMEGAGSKFFNANMAMLRLA